MNMLLECCKTCIEVFRAESCEPQALLSLLGTAIGQQERGEPCPRLREVEVERMVWKLRELAMPRGPALRVLKLPRGFNMDVWLGELRTQLVELRLPAVGRFVVEGTWERLEVFGASLGSC